MNKIKNLFFYLSASLIISLVIICLSDIAFANIDDDDYPKGKLEREIDGMESILNNNRGIFSSSGKVKSNATQDIIGNINKYLFEASIDTLKFAPLISADSNSGLIVTEWYSPANEKNVQFKVTVYIQGKVIEPESIEVIAFQRTKQKNTWSDATKSDIISNSLEDKIIRKARDLYLKSSR